MAKNDPHLKCDSPDARKKVRDAWYQLLYRNAIRRGALKVCDRWQKSFDNFAADLGQPKDAKATLCLRNRDLGYQPGNVFWGDWKARQQAAAHTRVLEHDGRRQSLSAWARELGVLRQSLAERLERYPPEIALSGKLPPRRGVRPVHASSQYLGVSWHEQTQKWEARYKAKGRLLNLGLFIREFDAARAVRRARLDDHCRRAAKRIRALLRKGARRDELLAKLRALMAATSHAVTLSPQWPRAGLDPARLRAGTLRGPRSLPSPEARLREIEALIAAAPEEAPMRLGRLLRTASIELRAGIAAIIARQEEGFR